MILGHGIDIADLGRVRILLTKMEEDFLHSTFTATERETENLPEDRVPFFAGRLAAKEAVAKALGTGFIGEIAMRQVEIARLPDGRPEVRLQGAAKKAADSLGVRRWLVSISHTETVTVACAIAEGTNTGFWSDKTMKARGQELIDPYRAERVKQGAYELSVGREAYITSDKGKKTKIAPDTPITIPPGQFGLLITREVVSGIPHEKWTRS